MCVQKCKYIIIINYYITLFLNFFPWVPLSKFSDVRNTTYDREIHFTLKWKQLSAFKLFYFVTITLFYMGGSPDDVGEVPVT